MRAARIPQIGKGQLFSPLNPAQQALLDIAKAEADEINRQRDAIVNANPDIPKDQLPFPIDPMVSITAGEDASTGTGIEVTLEMATSQIDNEGLTYEIAITAQIEHVCDYANFWHMRTPTGQLQNTPGSRNNHQCGLYVISHAMCLAFGYGPDIYGKISGALVRQMMKNRASRMTFDLIRGGFKEYRPRARN